jgi:hypothetical protein
MAYERPPGTGALFGQSKPDGGKGPDWKGELLLDQDYKKGDVRSRWQAGSSRPLEGRLSLSKRTLGSQTLTTVRTSSQPLLRTLMILIQTYRSDV